MKLSLWEEWRSAPLIHVIPSYSNWRSASLDVAACEPHRKRRACCDGVHVVVFRRLARDDTGPAQAKQKLGLHQRWMQRPRVVLTRLLIAVCYCIVCVCVRSHSHGQAGHIHRSSEAFASFFLSCVSHVSGTMQSPDVIDTKRIPLDDISTAQDSGPSVCQTAIGVLVGWMVGWLAGCLVGSLVGRSV